MIIGIGTDLTNINRIRGLLDRHGNRFRSRLFDNSERAKAQSQVDEAGTYAKRWAAKEACSKALGTGLKKGVSWRDITVVNLKSGKPTITLKGQSKLLLDQITPSGHKPIIHISLTDDHPWAQAFVVIEAVPSN